MNLQGKGIDSITLMHIVFILAGLCVGSFLNVVIYRLPKPDMSIAKPGSHCPICMTPIKWYDNIPVISYILLFQKCRTCRVYIPLRYPLVEMTTGFVFGYIFWFKFNQAEGPYLLMGVQCAFAAALIAVAFIDIDLRIIPDEISKGGMALAPVLGVAVPGLHSDFPVYADQPHLQGLIGSCTGVLVGFGLLWMIQLVGRLLFRKESMGFGDVKLMGLIGGILGFKAVFLVLVMASFTGMFFGIGSKIITKDSYLPFGPFLAIGALLTLVHKEEMMTFVTQTYPDWFYRTFLL